MSGRSALGKRLRMGFALPLALGLPLAAGGWTWSAEPGRDRVAAPSPETAPDSGSFTLLSYNVAGLPPGMSESKPIRNMLRISPKLNAYDLVLVQEDFLFHRLLKLVARHPFQSEPQPLSGIINKDFLSRVRGISVSDLGDLSDFLGSDRLTNDGLNRFSVFPFTGFQRHPWVACNGLTEAANDCLAPKGFSYARHEIADSIFIDVYNVHGDAGRSPEDEEARRQQFRELATFIQERSAGLPVIVAGDTNLQTPVPADEEILQEFMAATGLALASRTLGNERGLPPDVDRIFYRGGDAVTLVPTVREIAEEFVDGDGNSLSDHEGIRVEFVWQTTPSTGTFS